MTRYICVLDFEATCWDNELEMKRNPREIIEFPSILFKMTPKGKIVYISTFREFVKPVINPLLSDFCVKLTSITQDQVNNADVFKNVYKRHIQWLYENIPFSSDIFFVTVGHWDLRDILRSEASRYGIKLSKCYKRYSNLKDDYNFCYNKKCSSMVEMLANSNIEQTGHLHSGIDDVINMVKIIEKMISDGYTDFQLNVLE